MSDGGGAFQGAASGASAGSAFGPVGTFFGAVAGFALGSRAGRKRRQEERRIFKENTKQAYRIGRDTLTGINKNREDIADNYQRDVASATAKFAASGARVEGRSYQSVLGSVARSRDESLSRADLDEQAFRSSEAYKFIDQDYKFISQTNNIILDSDTYEGITSRELSLRTEGVAGESYFTEEQKGLLKTAQFDPRDSDNPEGAFNRYASAIVPTQEQYETFLFGSDEEKGRFESELTTRIEGANTEFEEFILERRLRKSREPVIDYDEA